MFGFSRGFGVRVFVGAEGFGIRLHGSLQAVVDLM